MIFLNRDSVSSSDSPVRDYFQKCKIFKVLEIKPELKQETESYSWSEGTTKRRGMGLLEKFILLCYFINIIILNKAVLYF